MVTEKVVGHGNDERMQVTLIGWANTHDDRLHNKTSQNKTTETKLPKIGRTKPPNPTITQTLSRGVCSLNFGRFCLEWSCLRGF